MDLEAGLLVGGDVLATREQRDDGGDAGLLGQPDQFFFGAPAVLHAGAADPLAGGEAACDDPDEPLGLSPVTFTHCPRRAAP